MQNFTIGIAGPVCGLSPHQIDAVADAIREAMKAAEQVSLIVWQDTGSRHPLGSDKYDRMVDSAEALESKFGGERLTLRWVEYGSTEDYVQFCDMVFICPGHAHSIVQKSRVSGMKRLTDALRVANRVVYAWNSETTR